MRLLMFDPYSTSLAASPSETATQSFARQFLGPFLCGLVMQLFMMGILTLQTWEYFSNFKNDNRLLKTTVGILFFAATVQTGTNLQLVYWTFVTKYGQLDSFKDFGWTLYYETAWTGMMAAIAQIFFLQRCYLISKSKIIFSLSVLGIALSFASSILLSVNLGEHGNGPLGKISQRRFFTALWLASSAVTDVILSCAVIYHLRKTKTGFTSTKRLLLRVIRLAFETAACTAVIAILDLITFEAFLNNGAHFFFQFIVGKAYCHSVMVTLLSRQKNGEGYSEGYQSTSDHQNVNFRPDRSHGVTVTTTRVRVIDSDPHASKHHDGSAPVDVIAMKKMAHYGEDSGSAHEDKIDRVL